MSNRPSSRAWRDGVPLGRYVVYDRIGAGGMATVHLGRLASVGGFSRVVAIKKLHDHVACEPKFVAMLLDEARLASSFRHANVIPTIDIVEDGPSIALVMDYVPGAALFDLMAVMEGRRQPIPAAVALSAVVHVLHGLHAAHEAVDPTGRSLGIVHRDASPHNVLLGTDGVARILDFGIAQASSRLQNTLTGELKGKVAYMAPEQLTSRPVDRRSDLFTVGTVLWELLASRRLFLSTSEPATMHAVLSKPVPPPVQGGAVANAVNAIVLRALDRDPDGRFQTCEEMALALEEAVSLPKPREVGAWVAEVAHGPLSEREALVRRIEGASSSSSGLERLLDAVNERAGRLDPSLDAPTLTVQVPPSRPHSLPPSRPSPASSARPLGPAVRVETDQESDTESDTVTSWTGRGPPIRKAWASFDSAITQIRNGAKTEIDEIRRLYEAGEITIAMARAGTVRGPHRLTSDTVLNVNVTLERLLRLPLNPRAAFMFSRIDGVSDVESILSVAGMPELEAIELLDKLLTVGALGIVAREEASDRDEDTLSNYGDLPEGDTLTLRR